MACSRTISMHCSGNWKMLLVVPFLDSLALDWPNQYIYINVDRTILWKQLRYLTKLSFLKSNCNNDSSIQHGSKKNELLGILRRGDDAICQYYCNDSSYNYKVKLKQDTLKVLSKLIENTHDRKIHLHYVVVLTVRDKFHYWHDGISLFSSGLCSMRMGAHRAGRGLQWEGGRHVATQLP